MLCLQSEPSHSLILLTLDELAKVSRRLGHEEADLFDELARQANKYQSKLDITSLCLSVLGGKAADVITKAISKCLKTEAKSDCKKTDLCPQPESSPLHNLYAPYPVPYSFPASFGGFPRGSRSRPRQFRPRGACHFCGSYQHMVKDCEKMKAAKPKDKQ